MDNVTKLYIFLSYMLKSQSHCGLFHGAGYIQHQKQHGKLQNIIILSLERWHVILIYGVRQVISYDVWYHNFSNVYFGSFNR
jgi:hypothetical protein